jgi:hypothetical protein
MSGMVRKQALSAVRQNSYRPPMIPPWYAHANIQPGSIGWRMGPGEEYLIEFSQWFARKHDDAKQRYAIEHPEPKGWEGFYARRGVKPRS